jgi:hypothetical protein
MVKARASEYQKKEGKYFFEGWFVTVSFSVQLFSCLPLLAAAMQA